MQNINLNSLVAFTMALRIKLCRPSRCALGRYVYRAKSLVKLFKMHSRVIRSSKLIKPRLTAFQQILW